MIVRKKSEDDQDDDSDSGSKAKKGKGKSKPAAKPKVTSRAASGRKAAAGSKYKEESDDD